MSEAKIMKTLNGYTVYDEAAHREIETLKGAAPGLVFDTVTDMEAYVAEHSAELRIGQDLYIRQADVPDYWWDGTQAIPVETDMTAIRKEMENLSEAIPAKTSDLTNDSGFITRLVADLTNYYTKSQTYTQAEINALMSAIPKFAITVVSALPTSGISGTTVYLVKSGSDADLYTEYIYVNGAWEILGSQRVDLTGYATETWVNTKLTDYLPAAQLQTAINTALAQAKESGEFDGAPGEPGVSPTVSVSAITGGHRITITDKNGTKTVDVMDGEDGDPGEPGNPGDPGRGIVSVVRTSGTGAAGMTDTYTITYTDNTTSTFDVYNGKDGEPYTLTDADKTAIAKEAAGLVDVPDVDDTLKVSGAAADAAKVGTELSSLSEAIGDETTARENAIADLKAQGVQQTPLFAESVEWLNENGDTTKLYVLPDGYIYARMHDIVTTPNKANDSTWKINSRPTPNGTVDGTTAHNGCYTSPAIEIDNTWGDCIVNISGIEKLVDQFYSPVYVYYYSADGASLGYASNAVLGTPTVSGELTLPASVNIANTSYWASTKFVRLMLGVVKNAAMTSANVTNLVVNIERFDVTEAKSVWKSTGHMFNTDVYGQAIEQNAAAIGVLQTDVETLKEAVKTTPSQSGVVWYALGDSITKGYGVGEDACWVKYVMQYNGYDAEKSKNLGISGLGFAKSDPNYSKTARTVVDENDFSAVDLVTIAIGINDWKEPFSIDTVKSEMAYCFTKILTDNPYCKIIFILPFNIWLKGSASTNWALGYSGSDVTGGTLQDFIGTQKSVCEEYGIQVIDMTKDSVINKTNIETVLYDKIHPDADCHKALGKELARRITFA